MSFDALLGNEQLKIDLARSLQTGHISHCYLITGPEGSGKHTLAKLLAAAILCQSRDKPCGVCHPCRKVLEGLHPDFITVDDPEHKTVSVDVIRRSREDVFIQPNEADHKIYLFPRAQDMGLPGQNALLKILEEPPAYAVFLLLAASPEKLLPTVRSRCRELKLSALPREMLESRLSQDFPQASREDIRRVYSRMAEYIPRCVGMRYETLTDDGINCVIEWVHIVSDAGRRERNRIAMSGIAAYERGEDGLLCAVRISDYAGMEGTIDWSQLPVTKEYAESLHRVDVFPL